MAIELLKMRINKVLPLVYDETLSYYEAVCKMGTRVNECITTVNEMSDTVDTIGTEVNRIDATIYDNTASDGQVLTADGEGGASYEDPFTYTAGANIQIIGNVISATDTTYTSGSGIAITGNEIRNTGVISIGDKTGDITLGDGLRMSNTGILSSTLSYEEVV